jgi:hypothetical protein
LRRRRHCRGELEEVPRLTPSENVLAADWFALQALPDASEVGHHGWALDTIGKVLVD